MLTKKHKEVLGWLASGHEIGSGIKHIPEIHQAHFKTIQTLCREGYTKWQKVDKGLGMRLVLVRTDDNERTA